MEQQSFKHQLSESTNSRVVNKHSIYLSGEPMDSPKMTKKTKPRRIGDRMLLFILHLLPWDVLWPIKGYMDTWIYEK